MQGQFSDDALEQALFEFIEAGYIADFEEYFDFGATCMRPDGSYYGISGGKCRKGTESGPVVKKRGRPAGGKNVAKAAPGDAAARMKAAYDKLVGMDLSRVPGGVAPDKNLVQDLLRFQKALSIARDVPAHMPGRNEEISRLKGEIAKVQAKLHPQQPQQSAPKTPAPSKEAASKINPQNVLAKLEAAKKEMGKHGDAMERLQGASGEVRSANRAEWERARDNYSQAAAQYKLALQKKADYGRLFDDVAKRANAVGMEHMREKDPAKRAELEARYEQLNKQLERLQPAFTKEGTNTWMAKMGVSVRPSEMWQKGTPTKPPTPEAKPIVQSHRALEKEAEAKFRDWARAQSAEEKAYQQVIVAKRDKLDPEKIEELRVAYRQKVKENDDAERVWREANAKAQEAGSAGQTLLTRESDRVSVKLLKQEAKDWVNLAGKMQNGADGPTDAALVKIGIDARKELIKNKKQAQDDNIVASMNLSPAAKQVHALNRNAERLAGVNLRVANKLRELIKKEENPERKAKLQKRLEEANRLRLLGRDEVDQNWMRYNARKEASRAKAEALLAAPAMASRIKKMSEERAAASLVVAGLNKKQESLDAAAKIALQQREAAENRLGINQQRANKYASMIANAKSPSEKKLLQEAFNKAQPSLNREAMSAMQAMVKAEKDHSNIQKEQIRIGNEILLAQKKRNALRDQMDAIKANGTVASYKTQSARENAKETLKEIEESRRRGNLEILGGMKPEFDLSVGPGSGAKALSSGAYGTAFKKGDATVKYGRIGKEEVSAMQRAHAAGVGPQVFKGERNQGPGETAGRFAYEYVKGKTLMDLGKGRDVPMELKEQFWQNRAKMHLNYVAHNDLHPGNVVVDGKNMKFIDFGLAKVGEKAALGEALGMDKPPGKGQGGPFEFSVEGDRQAKRWGKHYAEGSDGKMPQKLQRILDNRKNVEDAMLKDGLSKDVVAYFMKGGNYFRADPHHFERYNWALMSDQAAARYLDILYDGVIS